MGLAVRSFDDHLNEMWSRVGDGRVIATPVQRLAVLEESVNDWQPSVLPAGLRSRGLARSLELLVQRLAECDREVRLPAEPSAGGDILALAVRYRELLSSAGLVEQAEAHRLAVDYRDQIDAPAVIAVDGFTSLTPAQEAFVVAAAARSEVYVALTFSEQIPATAAAADLVARLSGHGETIVCREDGHVETAELHRIRAYLGSLGSPAVGASGAVILSEAWGMEAEAARIVAEVQDALAAGIDAESIAVVFRDAGRAVFELRRAFGEAAIPVAFDTRIAFGTTPLGRVLLLLLGQGANAHAHVLDVLRSPYSPSTNEVLDRFDAQTRSGGLAGSTSPIAWFSRHHPETAAFLRSVERARTATVAHAESRWYALVNEMLRRSWAVGDEDACLVDAAVMRVFMDALTGVTALGLQAGSSTLLGVLERSSVALSPPADWSGVRVMNAQRARGGTFSCVIVGGLVDGSFPARAHEGALSAPGVDRELRRAGIDMDERAGVGQERLLFYQVVSRATDRLVLSRQSFNTDGVAVRGSIFLEELLDLYRDPVSGEAYAGMPPIKRLGLDGMAENPSGPRTLRRSHRASASAGLADARLVESRRRGAARAPSLSAQARDAVARRERFSASEIEAYLTCPYHWCVQRLVRAEELDERIDSAATGSLGHEIMSGFYERFTAVTGVERVTPDTLQSALSIHEQVAGECLDRMPTRTAAEAAACRTIARRTRAVVERDATLLPGFTPILHEWSFGLTDGDAGEDLGGFYLGGRIDRIDSDGDRLVLTDYKSGMISTEHGADKMLENCYVQLLLYASVASRRLGGEVAAVLYRPLRDAKPRGLVRADAKSDAFVRTDVVEDATAMSAQMDAARALAAEAVERMRAGDITPSPRGGTCPDYCAARAYCCGWRRNG
jgi:ATP-dependent helicase/DNAse subunit B